MLRHDGLFWKNLWVQVGFYPKVVSESENMMPILTPIRMSEKPPLSADQSLVARRLWMVRRNRFKRLRVMLLRLVRHRGQQLKTSADTALRKWQCKLVP